MSRSVKGSCLCGAVAFEAETPKSVNVCHCSMCRRWTGGPFMACHADGGVAFSREDGLTWYDSSDWAERGFCSVCGSSLFYRLKDKPSELIILAGALDLPDGMTLGSEIFIDEKPDFYDLAGERPRLTGPEFLAQLQGGNQT